MKFIKIIAILALAFPQLALANPLSWVGDKSGVAWGVEKREFLVMSKKVYGYNYDITTKVNRDGDSAQIVVDIPVDTFSSGEAERDGEVAKMLKGDVRKAMTFTSTPLSAAELQDLMGKKAKSIAGQLAIGDKEYPMTFNITYGTDEFLYGNVKTAMSKLGVQPPALVGGVVMKVGDDLQLLVKLKLSELAG